MNSNEENRYGSARWSDRRQLQHAGLLAGKGAYTCHDQSGKSKIQLPSDGSVAYFGGAGCAKSAGFFMPNLLGDYADCNSVTFDPRGELTAVSTLAATRHGYSQYSFNPTKMPWAPSHKTNPFDFLTLDSTSLIADNRKVLMNIQPVSMGGNGQSRWWEAMALNDLCMLNLWVLERDNRTSPKSLYKTLIAIEGDLDAWAENLDGMMRSRFADVRSWAGQIMQRQESGRDSFSAPMSELYTNFAFMQDERIADELDGDDFSMGDVATDKKVRIKIMVPMEYVGIWASALRLLIGAAVIQKMRKPQARRVAFYIDECGQLGKFSAIPEIYTYGRGAGCFAACSWQSFSQAVDNYGREQAVAILSSAQCRIFKGIRDIQTAEMVSSMAGMQTLEYDAGLQQGEAKMRKRQAARRMLAGESLFQLTAEMRHYDMAGQHRTKQPRQLITPAEAMNLSGDQLIAFISGMDVDPILGCSYLYFKRPEYAGWYLDNPYHEQDRVTIKGLFKEKTVPVITETVPEKYAHLPQYKSGLWRYVQGYKP